MTENEALALMIPPTGYRPSKPYLGCVIQIHLTRACDLACYSCTQNSQLGGKLTFMSPTHFEQACESLIGYKGVVGIFGGNPALSPDFISICQILRRYFPKGQCGLWCNNPMTEEKAVAMRETFDPRVSNLNCHLSGVAYDRFKAWWPESMPFGLYDDSRHSPPYVAMKDVIADEGERWKLISNCDINQRWSAMIGVFRGQLRAWFCEIAGAQSIIHQDEPDYPDTGLVIPSDPKGELLRGEKSWWELSMDAFAHQVRKHCHECGVPLRGYGELSQSNSFDSHEQVSVTHQSIYRPKVKSRKVELVTVPAQLGERLQRVTDYLKNGRK